jgi:hypothetical protein
MMRFLALVVALSFVVASLPAGEAAKAPAAPAAATGVQVVDIKATSAVAGKFFYIDATGAKQPTASQAAWKSGDDVGTWTTGKASGVKFGSDCPASAEATEFVYGGVADVQSFQCSGGTCTPVIDTLVDGTVNTVHTAANGTANIVKTTATAVGDTTKAAASTIYETGKEIITLPCRGGSCSSRSTNSFTFDW